MAIGSPQWMYSSGEAYEIDQSLKFNDDDSAYLSKTFGSSPTSLKTWTLSCWIKRSSTGTTNYVLSYDSGGNPMGILGFNSSDQFHYYDRDASSGSADIALYTTQLFRDPNAWYHFVIKVDTTQGTESNRVKIYLNGLQITAWDTETYPAQNYDTILVGNHYVNISGWGSSPSSSYIDGYLSEVNFIDGQALTPADFGETGDYGEWKPVQYSGTYGTNGFYLPFKQDYTVEGFSTVTYKGAGADQYIGGTGFSPDMVWIKSRSDAEHHQLYDSVRGAYKDVIPNLTAAEGNTVADADAGLVAFNTDGFSCAGNTARTNGSGKTYVAWNWDMGNPTSNIGSTGIQFDNSDDDIVFELGTALGTGSFTVEYWTYFDSLQNYDTIFSTSRSTTGFNAGTDANGMAVWYSLGDDRILESASGTYATGQWYHTAYVRNGTTLKVYVNGVEKDSATDNNDYSEQTASVGALDGASEFSGIILDSLRVSNVARYTSNNFETPQARFTSDSNTLFLLNAPSESSTTLTDSSSNSLSLTITGTSVVSSSGSKPAFTNTDGSITSLVRANPTYGQSIVSWTGNGTVGHGLSSSPDMFVVKPRNATGAWWTWHKDLSNTSQGYLQLNSTAAEATNSLVWDNASPVTSTTINANTAYINNATDNYIAYCFHSVTGYSKFGSYTGNASTDGSLSVTTGFAPAFLMVKRTNGTGGWVMVDNTRNPSNPINKYSQANTTDTEASGSLFNFTSTGFNLLANLADINSNGGTYIYMAFADNREYAYWLDQSGNNNDWTSNNLTESDVMVDSPTNNFATFDALRGRRPSLFEGNLLTETSTNTISRSVDTNFRPVSGKWYVEVYIKVDGANSGQNATNVGVANDGFTAGDVFQGHNNGVSYQMDGTKYINTTNSAYGSSYATGDIIGIAYDVDNDNITFYKNGVSQGELTSGFDLSNGRVVVATNSSTATGQRYAINFGQDSSFAGLKTAQGNQDSNNIGDFYYTPPSGFLALCTKNLPDVAVVPSEHFNTVTYSGNATARSITTGFQPDWIWIKSRSVDHWHTLTDSVRGITKNLYSNETNAEQTYTNRVTSLNSDGFSLGTEANVNQNSQTFVAWNWKANGSGSSNTDGSITSTVSANTDAGFSIVSYTGNGTDGATIGHGLNQAPEIAIIKNREQARNWTVYGYPNNDAFTQDGSVLYLNLTDAMEQSTTKEISLGSSLITVVDSGDDINANNDNHIAYCFHSVDGYSKVGSYTGNGNADGTFVYTGFAVKWVLIKRTNSAGQGAPIFDSARNEFNVTDKRLNSNDSVAEVTTDGNIDLLSNGFKARNTDGSVNTSGGEYIYIAFAETPFKYSNGR